MSAMRAHRVSKACAILAAAVAALLSVGMAGASANQEVGSTCVAYATGALRPQPNVIPAGVITRWRVQAPPNQTPIQQRIVVNRQVGEEDDGKVGESALETIGPGINEFATRVPAPEYAHVGLTGPD